MLMPLILLVSVLAAPPEPDDKPVDTSKTYTVCGCGCCPALALQPDQPQRQQTPEKCVSNSSALNELQEADKEYRKKNAELCKTAGCIIGVRYRVCNSTKSFGSDLNGHFQGFMDTIRNVHIDF